jgi:hypothetical protein
VAAPDGMGHEELSVLPLPQQDAENARRCWSRVLEAYFSFYEFHGCLTEHLNNQALVKVEDGTPPRNARERLTQDQQPRRGRRSSRVS